MAWKKTILAFSLLVAVVALPVSMVICHTALGVYFILWLSEGQWKLKSDILLSNPLVWGYVVFFMLNVIGVIYSDNTESGWFNVEKKLSLILFPVALATTLSLDHKMIRIIFKGFIFTCAVATLYCLAVAFAHSQLAQGQINFNEASLSLYQQLNPDAGRPWMFFSYIELASGIGIHPTYLALYLVFSVLLLFQLSAESFGNYSTLKQTGIILLFLYFEIIIVLLSSRILIFAFAVISIASILYMAHLSGLKTIARAFFLMILLSPLILVVMVNPVSRYRNIQEPAYADSYLATNGLYSFSTGIRKSLWWLGINTIMEVNPIIGAGPGDVTNVIRTMSNRTGEQNVLDNYDPHNQFMYTQIGLGLMGLTALLACVYLPAWVAWRERNYFYLGFIFLITLVCSTESVLESQKGVVFFAIFNPLLVFQYARLTLFPSKRLVYG